MSLKPKRVDFDATWYHLKDTVEVVITLRKVDRHVWNDCFTDVYALCVAFPEPLSDRLYKETKEYLEHHVQKLLEIIKTSPDGLLKSYHQQWKEYSQGISYLNKLYMHLNAQHVKKQKYPDTDLQYGRAEPVDQMLEIGELGLNLWKEHVIEVLKEKIIHLLLDGIKNDRVSDSPNQSIFHGVIHSFVEVEEYRKEFLMYYQDVFENKMLEETGGYYTKEADRLLQENDCSHYMEKVLQKLDEENLRSRKFLHPSSYPKVQQVCEQKMVEDHLMFLTSECIAMVQQESRKDLHNMFLLVRSIPPGIEALMSELKSHISKIGLQAINNLKSDNVPQLFVESLLNVHNKYLGLIREVFTGDQQFVGVLDKAMSYVINFKDSTKTMCRSPELLSKYCDSLLKKTTKACNDSEIEEKLSHSITIFKYLDDKDLFQKFYAKMLAKRLIYNQSVSMDSEELMINKLKQACGYDFTSKLHRMYTDMNVSADLNNRFSAHNRKCEVDLGINFSISVLQAGAWPLVQTAVSPFAMPKELERSVQRFEDFYSNEFNGRKLTWLHHLCSAELKLGYLKKPYIVAMSTYQMAIILLFEETNKLSYPEIQDSTKLNDEHLVKNLQSLVESKLLTSTSDKAFDKDSTLELNQEFFNKRTKFKITAVPQKETNQEEVKQTQMSVEEDRKMCLQAAIVRIMKARKVLRHNSLIQEVINQSRHLFVPNINMIKKCIESLIDKQYLERTPNSAEEYSYIA